MLKRMSGMIKIKKHRVDWFIFISQFEFLEIKQQSFQDRKNKIFVDSRIQLFLFLLLPFLLPYNLALRRRRLYPDI